MPYRQHLDIIDIPEPCEVPWESMEGDDRVRYCQTCRHDVYNLSAIPRAEAEALIEKHEGRLCVQLLQRADGTVVTADGADARAIQARLARAKMVSKSFTVSAAAGALAMARWVAATGERPAPPAYEAPATVGTPFLLASELPPPPRQPEPPPPPEEGPTPEPEDPPPPPRIRGRLRLPS